MHKKAQAQSPTRKQPEAIGPGQASKSDQAETFGGRPGPMPGLKKPG